jgi:hypothetical protein
LLNRSVIPRLRNTERARIGRTRFFDFFFAIV